MEVELIDENDVAAVQALIKDLEENTRSSFGSQTSLPLSSHLLCTTHFKKDKLRRVRELRVEARSETMTRDVGELEHLLREVPEDGQMRAREYRRQKRVKRPSRDKRATAAGRLKALAPEIYEKWERVWQQTNNATEPSTWQCLKIRSKHMRGFKDAGHIRGFARLRGWIIGQGDRVELGSLL